LKEIRQATFLVVYGDLRVWPLRWIWEEVIDGIHERLHTNISEACSSKYRDQSTRSVKNATSQTISNCLSWDSQTVIVACQPSLEEMFIELTQGLD
jgi:hypothetical protein